VRVEGRGRAGGGGGAADGGAADERGDLRPTETEEREKKGRGGGGERVGVGGVCGGGRERLQCVIKTDITQSN
jgi:hypothetical protein